MKSRICLAIFVLLMATSDVWAVRTVSSLTTLAAKPAAGDLVEIVDVSDTSMAATGTNKRITYAYLFSEVLAYTIGVTDTTSATTYVALFPSATGNLSPNTDEKFKYNATTGFLEAYGFTATRRAGVVQSFAMCEDPNDGNMCVTHSAPPTGTGFSGYGSSTILYEPIGPPSGGQSKVYPTPTANVSQGVWTGPHLLKSQSLTLCKSIDSPTASSDPTVWRPKTAITITSAHCLATGGVSLTGHFKECDANGGSCTNIDTGDMVCVVGTNTNDDGSLSNASIDAGDYIKWNTTSVSGTQTEVIVCFDYVYN